MSRLETRSKSTVRKDVRVQVSPPAEGLGGEVFGIKMLWLYAIPDT